MALPVLTMTLTDPTLADGFSDDDDNETLEELLADGSFVVGTGNTTVVGMAGEKNACTSKTIWQCNDAEGDNCAWLNGACKLVKDDDEGTQSNYALSKALYHAFYSNMKVPSLAATLGIHYDEGVKGKSRKSRKSRSIGKELVSVATFSGNQKKKKTSSKRSKRTHHHHKSRGRSRSRKTSSTRARTAPPAAKRTRSRKTKSKRSRSRSRK
jgi:hypothetical protein